MDLKKISIKTAALAAACCMCISGTSAAGEAVEIKDSAADIQAAAPAVSEQTEAFEFEIVNGTDKDIEYFAIVRLDNGYDENADIVKLQKALIEKKYLDDVADGSYGPKTQKAVADFRKDNKLSEDGGMDEEMLTLLYGSYDDGNLLKKDTVLKAGEKVLISYKAEPEGDEPAEASPDAAKIMDAVAGVSAEPGYMAVVGFADEEEYILHVFPVADISDAEISLSDGILYAQYKSAASGEAVSTLELEKGIDSILNPPVPDYGDYSDYGDYDYSDYGYYDYSDYGYYDDGGAQGGDGCIDDGLFY
ncbi:MAG: peptidoglycan-binding protein [Parasporobacterium sp.]|nr:peptidoglycan-binding protein [Parasporobacterium sp.]